METTPFVIGPYPVSLLRQTAREWATDNSLPVFRAALTEATGAAVGPRAAICVALTEARLAEMLATILDRRLAATTGPRRPAAATVAAGRPSTCPVCRRTVGPRHYYRSGQPRCRNRRWWTADRVAALDALLAAGEDDVAIAHRLGCTPSAVKIARQRFGLTARTWRTLNAGAIAHRLGIGCPKTVSWWIREGWLAGRVVPGRGASGIQYLVTEEELRAFLADPAHWHRWEPARITDPGLRAWAVADRADARVLTHTEVAALCGVQRDTVRHWIAKGWLPAVRNGRGNRRVREADAVAFRAARMAGKVHP